MTRFLTSGTLAACVLGLAGGQQQPTFRAGSDLVRVFAAVWTKESRDPRMLYKDDEGADEVFKPAEGPTSHGHDRDLVAKVRSVLEQPPGPAPS